MAAKFIINLILIAFIIFFPKVAEIQNKLLFCSLRNQRKRI